MNGGEVKWIKIHTGIFDDEKIKLIDSLPDRDGIFVIWIKLLTLAGKINNSGLIYVSEELPYTEEMFSTIFNRPINTVRLALDTFKRFNMIEIFQGKIHITNWEKHQNIEGLEKIRHQTRIRVEKHRSKLKELPEFTEKKECNVTVTQQKRREKKKDQNRLDEIIDEFSSNEEVKKALYEFSEHRKNIKKPLSDLSLKKLFNLLNNYKDTDKIKMLENSILNGWQGVFPLKEKDNKQKIKDHSKENDEVFYYEHEKARG